MGNISKRSCSVLRVGKILIVAWTSPYAYNTFFNNKFYRSPHKSQRGIVLDKVVHNQSTLSPDED